MCDNLSANAEKKEQDRERRLMTLEQSSRRNMVPLQPFTNRKRPPMKSSKSNTKIPVAIKFSLRHPRYNISATVTRKPIALVTRYIVYIVTIQAVLSIGGARMEYITPLRIARRVLHPTIWRWKSTTLVLSAQVAVFHLLLAEAVEAEADVRCLPMAKAVSLNFCCRI